MAREQVLARRASVNYAGHLNRQCHFRLQIINEADLQQLTGDLVRRTARVLLRGI